MNTLKETVESFGGHVDSLVSFGSTTTPDQLPYVTLFDQHGTHGQDLHALTGVYEWQRHPLIFLAESDKLESDAHVQRLRRRIALRGDAPFLGVVDRGTLVVYEVGLDSATPNECKLHLDTPNAVTFPYLASKRPGTPKQKQLWISRLIFRLLNGTLNELRANNVAEEDAVSLVGRALFTRFLADRDLIPDALATSPDVPKLFDTPNRIAATSRWLDETFNGDFLPLSKSLPVSLSQEACRALGDVMRRAPRGQLYLGWETRWDYLDFAHIPVGVLSQAYEAYLREHLPNRQKSNSAYYTPLQIVDLLVGGAFDSLRHNGDCSRARVLDPAVGAGIFLISAFRELVAERWRETGRRPQTPDLREILYDQLTGFDVDEIALRFGALGLYLASIEYDPHPEPVQKLRFERNIRGTVLLKVSDTEAATYSDGLGSLGDQVGPEHNGIYDLVVGNPPWTGARKLPNWPTVVKRSRDIARTRLGDHIDRARLPNEVPDIAFLWRALEWAKPNGRIAMALHARILFQHGDGMSEARSQLFSALRITSVINGSELRNTNIWPQVSAPFCLLFASNRLPDRGSGLLFLSPRIEAPINSSGLMRIDPANSEAISAHRVATSKSILKTLFRGTRLDLEISDRLSSLGIPSLREYWTSMFGISRGRLMQSGSGYQRLRPSSRIRKNSVDLEPGVPAGYLHGLNELDPQMNLLPVVSKRSMRRFSDFRIHDPRSKSMFTGPLLVIHKAPHADRNRIALTVSDEDLLYNESFYGYSASGHSHAKTLVRYLALVLGSQFALWHALITSGEFGFEREKIEKSTIDDTPLIPLNRLDEKQTSRIHELFSSIASEPSDANWEAVDRWVAQILGLDQTEVQTISDTLAQRLPYRRTIVASNAAPSHEQIEYFVKKLTEELSPWGTTLGTDFHIRVVRSLPERSPWEVLRLTLSRSSVDSQGYASDFTWQSLIQQADASGASEIVVPEHRAQALWIARLRQTHYWTQSQARLLAQRIIWRHITEIYPGKRK